MASSNERSIEDNEYAHNWICNQTLACLYINGSSGYSAKNQLISGNFFRLEGELTNRVFVLLIGECRFSKIEGGRMAGPGSSISGTKAVVLDSVGSNIAVRGITMTGIERPLWLYSGSAMEYSNITFSGNDCSSDMSSQTLFITATSPATFGPNIVQRDNTIENAYSIDYWDKQNNRIETWCSGSPEGVIAAGVGSVVHRDDGGLLTSLYVKTSGSGNTGWTAK